MRELTRQAKRDSLVKAAKALFYQQGFQGTSVEAIVTSLGMTKPFFYAYFESKQALIDHLFLDSADKAAACATAIKRGAPADEQLRRYVEAYTKFSIENRDLGALFLTEERNLSPKACERLQAVRQERHRRVKAIVEKGVSAGIFNVDNSKLVAHTLIGMIRTIYIWYDSKGALSPDQVGRFMAVLALNLVGFGVSGKRRVK